MSFMSTSFTLFVNDVQFLLQKHKGSVTSWIRSPKRNKEVGGASDSLHCLGLAVDVVLDSSLEKVDFIVSCQSLYLKVIDEGDHIHVQVIR